MAGANPVRTVVIALAVALIAGCAYSPGMQLNVEPPSKENELEGPVQEGGYSLVPLTPKVMEKLHDTAVAKQTSSVVPEEWRKDTRQYDYRVGPGDILAVTVWDHPELTNPAKYFSQESVGQRVSPDGSMFFPYAGAIQVG